MSFLRRLFLQPKTEPEPPAITHPEVTAQEEAQIIPAEQLSFGLHIGKMTNVGKVRERNEDSLFTVESFIQYDYGHELFGLLIVADGMGGHQKGDVASSVAARATANFILRDVYLPCLVSSNQNATSPPINEVLVSAVERANALVREAVPDGGTTLTAALIMGHNAYIAHVGDTRAYFIDQTKIKQITEDHSLAQRLKDIGQATPEQVAQVDHVLYRAVGQGSTIEVDTYLQHLPPGSSLLVCSDGLWKGVNDDEMLKEIVNTSATPQEACQRLVAVANKNGGEDNITGLIVSMGAES
ncbi:MAG: serine/threonine-protein phosphatase [Anaerolineae bacterium]|nr:serine/threonine-protein phosphatase [Anaerolineae bacterium]